jgi:hypothetical protein
VVTLGGDGQELADYQSVCAAGILEMSKLDNWTTQVIDSSDGASGLILAPDGGIVLDCGGTIRILYK